MSTRKSAKAVLEPSAASGSKVHDEETKTAVADDAPMNADDSADAPMRDSGAAVPVKTEDVALPTPRSFDAAVEAAKRSGGKAARAASAVEAATAAAAAAAAASGQSGKDVAAATAVKVELVPPPHALMDPAAFHYFSTGLANDPGMAAALMASFVPPGAAAAPAPSEMSAVEQQQMNHQLAQLLAMQVMAMQAGQAAGGIAPTPPIFAAPISATMPLQQSPRSLSSQALVTSQGSSLFPIPATMSLSMAGLPLGMLQAQHAAAAQMPVYPSPPSTPSRRGGGNSSVHAPPGGSPGGSGSGINSAADLLDQNRGRWSAQDDLKLREAVSQFQGRNWKSIAHHAFANEKSDVQCLHRWQKVLKPGLVKGPWTTEEDAQVVALVNELGLKKWSAIAAQLKGRLGKQCRERWYNHLDPQIKKETWSSTEDQLIYHYHSLLGNRWASIAKLMPGRTDNAIKV